MDDDWGYRKSPNHHPLVAALISNNLAEELTFGWSQMIQPVATSVDGRFFFSSDVWNQWPCFKLVIYLWFNGCISAILLPMFRTIFVQIQSLCGISVQSQAPQCLSHLTILWYAPSNSFPGYTYNIIELVISFYSWIPKITGI